MIYLYVVVSAAAVDVRLTNNSFGNVEVYYNDTWGTVCDDEWDLVDANVVCKQLNYSHALLAYHSSFFGMGTGPIWMDNVQCSGNEASISDCSFKGWGITDCNHGNNAGVRCKGIIKHKEILNIIAFSDTPEEVEYSIRLTNENIVEIYNSSQWLSVCSNGWTRNEGAVACRQNGYVTYLDTYPSTLTTTSGITGVKCYTGHELNISQCDLSNITTSNDCNKVVLNCSGKLNSNI